MMEEVLSGALPVLIDDDVCLMLAGSVVTVCLDISQQEQQERLLRELRWIVTMHPRPATFTEKLAVFLYEKRPQLTELLNWPQNIAPVILALQHTAQDLCQPAAMQSEKGIAFSHFVKRRNFLKVLLRHAPNLPSESVVAQLSTFILDAVNPVAEAVLITGYMYRYLPLIELLQNSESDKDDDGDLQLDFVQWLTDKLYQGLPQP